MIKYLIAFMLFTYPCLAGTGIGGFPYPGPGVTRTTNAAYYSDAFTYSNGNLPSPWTTNIGRIPIVDNNQITASNFTRIGIYGQMPTSNYTACISINPASTSEAGTVVRAMTGETTQYDILAGGSNIRIRRVINGFATDLQSITISLNNGDEVCLSVSGSSPVVLNGMLNGTQVITYSDSADNRLQSGTNVGLIIYTGYADNWAAYE